MLPARRGSQVAPCRDPAAALASIAPDAVLVSWMPRGQDWTAAIRACAPVQEYVLLGVPDGCGDPYATWGVLPEDPEDYGIDPRAPPLYAREGFRRRSLPGVEAHQLGRFDTTEARFSAAVAFTRDA